MLTGNQGDEFGHIAEAQEDLGREAERRAGYKITLLFRGEGALRRDLYAKHVQFFALGATFKERLFMAANRVGKSEAGAYEVTCHLTGRYPAWWAGRRFTEPVQVWACGTTGETTRDIVQEKLFGPWQLDEHTGMIPAHLISRTQKRPHGLPGSIESAWVKHVSGWLSQIGFKTYEQGRKSFEGTAKHVIWCDEEPPLDCYIEMLYRTLTTKGITLVTFTPLQGMSDVVTSFMAPDSPEALASKAIVQAGWDDVPHLDENEKRALLANTPPFQRDARTKGTPQLGAGAIYALPESGIVVPDFQVPAHWPRAYGLDAGGGAKPTAVVWGARDPDSGTLCITNVYRRESPEPAVHVAAVKARGEWIPGVGDCAALIFTAHDAEQLIQVYQNAGLDIILPDKAVETGIHEVWSLMSVGLFKVFASCGEWFEEFRLYHRNEKGHIVKKNDHLMDATRYLVHSGMVRACVQPPPRASRTAQMNTSGRAWMS